MTRRNVAFILVVLAFSLPLAAGVIARSEHPDAVQPTVAVAELTGVATSAADGTTCEAAPGTHRLGDCLPEVCQISCPLDSCSAGPCDEGFFAKCVCRAGGHSLCGCVACP